MFADLHGAAWYEHILWGMLLVPAVYLKSETEKYAKVVKAIGVRLE